MIGLFSSLWLKSAALFEPIQRAFNGSFWIVFEEKFKNYRRGRILDLACGTGELRNHLNPKFYLGIDINPSYIIYCSTKHKHKNTSFLVADITKKVPREPFDNVFLISAAHHLSDQQIEKLLKAVKKINFKHFVLIDGLGYGLLKYPLEKLDAELAGGRYFRNKDRLSSLVKKHLKIVEDGVFSAQGSFYKYPYVIAKK